MATKPKTNQCYLWNWSFVQTVQPSGWVTAGSLGGQSFREHMEGLHLSLVHMEGLALSVAPVCLFHLCRQYQHSLMDHCLVLYIIQNIQCITTNQKFLRMRNLTCTAQVTCIPRLKARPQTRLWVDDNRAETRRASCFARFQPQLWVKFWTKGCLWQSHYHNVCWTD